MGSKIDAVAKGLAVLAKYEAGLCARNDVIQAGLSDDVSDDDAEALTLLGWHWNVDDDCWEVFV